MPQWVGVLIPSIQADLEKADQLSTFDAVQAIDGPIPSARRKIDESNVLSDMLDAARNELFPKMKSVADELKTLGYSSDWIDAMLDDITVRSDRWMESAASTSIVQGIDEIRDSLQHIELNGSRCVELARQIQETHRPRLAELATKIKEARGELGSSLGLPADTMLHELDRDPDYFLTQARDNVEAARTMLVQGRSEAAAAAIDTMNMEMARVEFLVETSKSAVQSFDKYRTAHQDSLAELRKRAAELTRSVQSARKSYAASALLVQYVVPQAIEPSGPSRAVIGNGLASKSPSVEQAGPLVETEMDSDVSQAAEPGGSMMADRLIDEAVLAAEQVDRLLGLAESEHRQGRVLMAAERLRKPTGRWPTVTAL